MKRYLCDRRGDKQIFKETKTWGNSQWILFLDFCFLVSFVVNFAKFVRTPIL